jgi:hypothetical protein
VIEWNVPRVLVVQAERGPDGKAYYGVISRHAMEKVREDELTESRRSKPRPEADTPRRVVQVQLFRRPGGGILAAS